MRAVSFLDSSGVGVLVAEQERLLGVGGQLILRDLQGIVRTALEILGLAAWIEIT